MKKEFLSFADFLATKKLSEEDFTSKTAEEQAGLYNELNNHNKEVINEMKGNIDNGVSKEEVNELIEKFQDSREEQMKSLNKTLEEIGLEIKASREKRKGKDQEKTLIESLKEMRENGTIGKIKDNSLSGMHLITKAAGTMTISGNVSGGNVPVEQRIPGLNTIASRQVRLMDLVSSGNASSNLISWVYQANKDGSAGGTSEGTAKNQIDYDLVVASQAVVKRTAYIKVSTEMLDDIEFIESEIRNELMRELIKDVESTAYSGNGTAPNMNGIKNVATAFAAGVFATSIDNANQVDVLTVAANQIKIAEHGMPTAILMNPSDVTALKLVKLSTTDKRYIDRLVTVGSTLMLDGIPIIETTLVTQDEYLIGVFDLATLYQKDGVSVMMGLDGNDLTNNTRTIIAEYRGAMVVKNNDRTAFVTGTFSTDQAALETP